MTAAERKPDEREKLYMLDSEIIEKIGVPEKVARIAFKVLDGDRLSGFPRKQALWGNRRYWPAVKAYLDRTGGITIEPSRRERHDQ
jgi:hypothetical protein